jgi:hypothetical protein
MKYEPIYRTNEERFEFLFDIWVIYSKKNTDNFEPMHKYINKNE